MMRFAKSALAAAALLLGTAAGATAQTPADSGRGGETMRSRGWTYLPRFEYRMPRMRLDQDHLRMDALERAERVRERTLELQDRLRDRQFALMDRLRDRRFDSQDRALRRQMELQERLMDRMHERMGRLDRVRSFVLRRRYRSI